jgi:hypothetical protein
MISCKLTREQLLEALTALDIAYANGWTTSKAIFTLQSYDNISHKQIWDVDRCSFTGEINLIVDAGSEKGEANYGLDSCLYKEETPESVKANNEKIFKELED